LKALQALPPDHGRSSRLKHILDHLPFELRWRGVEHNPSLHVGSFSEPSYSTVQLSDHRCCRPSSSSTSPLLTLAVVLYKRTRAADAPTVPSVSNGNTHQAVRSNSASRSSRVQILQSPDPPESRSSRVQILQSPDPPASSLQPPVLAAYHLAGPLAPLRAADEPREAREGRTS